MKRHLLSATRLATLGSLSLLAGLAHADWHTGPVKFVYSGYEGTVLTFIIEGWSRNNCTCYPTWPSHMCLIPGRDNLKNEYAILLLSKATGQPISVNIDETTCFASAIGVGQ